MDTSAAIYLLRITEQDRYKRRQLIKERIRRVNLFLDTLHYPKTQEISTEIPTKRGLAQCIFEFH